MEPKTYEIKTLEDILRAVNTENVENFLKDFQNFLTIWVGTKAMIELVDPKSLEMTTKSVEFDWIDDGKNEAKITVQAVESEHPSNPCLEE